MYKDRFGKSKDCSKNGSSTKIDYLDADVLGVAAELCNELSFVCKTLGPSGYNVLIDTGFNRPVFTKDGVSIIRAVHSSDPIKRMFLDKIKEVCNKTNNSGGDGTTTAFTILRSIILNGWKYVKAGYHPNDVVKGMQEVYEIASKYLEDNMVFKCTLDDIKNVAIVATNDSKLGGIIYSAICKMYDECGGFGFITVESSKSTKTYYEFSNGLSFAGGYHSPYFISEQASQSVYLDDPVVIIIKGILNDQEMSVKILEYLHFHNRPGLIVCDDLDKASMHTFILNQIKGVVKITAVKCDDADFLEDIAVVVGGKVIDREFVSFKEIDISSVCGSCSSARVTKGSTEIVSGRGDPAKIAERAELLKHMYSSSEGVINQEHNKSQVAERCSQMTRGVAVIKVGGSTDSESKQRQDRVMDGVSAVIVAEKDGACIGGGVTFLKLSRMLLSSGHLDKMSEAARAGAMIFIEALKAPARQILKNGNYDVEVIMHQILQAQETDPDMGFDAIDGKIKNLKDGGVLDSKAAVSDPLCFAVSIASLIITSAAVVTASQSGDGE